MTGPDRIWINEKWEAFLRPVSDDDTSGYIRRDPAVLAALPEVQAMIAAAYEAAATCTEWTAWGQRHNLTEASRRAIRALTTSDATAALAARDAAMIARGRVKGLREAATLLREQGYGTAPKQILARAAEIERESGA